MLENPVSIAPTRRSLSYSGDGTEMAMLMLKNLFLTIITLGIYRAWAKTYVRRYVWGHVTFEGDRASYVGTGEELFWGWVKLFGILAGLILGVRLLALVVPFLAILIPIAYFFIFGLAIYSGLRYRLSRTLWRQIRFGADRDKESTKEFLRIYLVGSFLSFITFGIYYPFFKHYEREFLTKKSRFGTAYFSYDAVASEYAGTYFYNLMLCIVTLGIYTPWMFRNLTAFRLEHTRFQGARIFLTLKGGDLLVFGLCAYFGTILTMGLAVPWIYNWGLGLFINNMHVDGEIDMSLVQARDADGSALAEDVVDGYDLDIGF